MIARLDQKWRELKKLLGAEEDSAFEEQPDPPVGPGGLEPAVAADASESWWSSLLPLNKAHVAVTSQEADAIVERVENLDKETNIRERLTKVQWQNRGLIVYSVICTIMFLYLLLSIFFADDSYALNQNRINPAGELQVKAGTKNPTPTTASVPQTPVAAQAGGALTSPPGEANALAAPPEPPGLPVGPELAERQQRSQGSGDP
jgi:hypothetical protein